MQRTLFPLPPTAHYAVGSVRAELEERYAPRLREALALGKWVSYVGNKQVPGLRLYRYKEAFSHRLVQHFIARFAPDPDTVIFDPFSGLGTTALVAMQMGHRAVGVDRLPVAVFAAQALTLLTTLAPGTLQAAFEDLRARLETFSPAPVADDVRIMRLAFAPEVLERLRRWKAAIASLPSPQREVMTLLLLAVLEPCSYTAKDGQFLRLRRDKAIPHPDEALAAKVREAEADVAFFARARPKAAWGPLPQILLGDARDLSGVAFPAPPGLVVTSPPYANRYDYTRTYSLELAFQFVRNVEELRALRHSVLRSHIESRMNDQEPVPHPAVDEVVAALAEKHLNNPRIPTMLQAYFVDMERVLAELGRVMAPGGHVVMVVDNVRFEGEMVPVDLILADLAARHGLETEEIPVARYKGNSSQQMKKYGRVPVRESILIWRKIQHPAGSPTTFWRGAILR